METIGFGNFKRLFQTIGFGYLVPSPFYIPHFPGFESMWLYTMRHGIGQNMSREMGDFILPYIKAYLLVAAKDKGVVVCNDATLLRRDCINKRHCHNRSTHTHNTHVGGDRC